MSTRRVFVRSAIAAAAALGTRSLWAATPPKKILILGGTAFLGPALVAVARARGHTLTLFNRGKTNPGRFTDIEQLHGDRNGQLDALRGRRWDAVIDDSGYVPRHVHDSATLLAPSVQHYLFVSTISVYADGSKPIDENSPVGKLEKPTEDPKLPGAYGPLKALCETAAQAAMPGRVAVVRPGLIVGPEDPTDRFTYWPLRLARGGEVLAPGRASDPVSYIDVRDLAQWMITVVERKLTGTFNATGPATTLGVGALIDGCQQATHSDAKLTWVDVDFLDKQNVHGWSDLPVWLSPRGDELYLGRISRDKAVQAGLTFRSVADTARDTLAWWQTLPEARRAQQKAGLTAERERQVLAAWHARK